MVWPLTSRAVLAAATLVVASNPLPAQHDASLLPTADQRAAHHSVHWVGIPLGEAVARLRRVADAEILLDRRVDPSQRVTLSVDMADTDELIARLAGACALGNCSIGPLRYLGPRDVAERLPTLAAERRREVAGLAGDQRRSLATRKSIAWPRLTVPRDLVVQLAHEHGWRVEHAERIPYDLWPAGQLAPLPIADQLTLLLAGFDRTYRLHAERSTLEIVGIDWSSITAAAEPERRQRPRRRVEAREVFTLRVVERPVGEVLMQLGQRLGWRLSVDEAGIRAAGRSLDERVSFSVENADADTLLAALLAPVGLAFEREGNRVSIGAEDANGE